MVLGTHPGAPWSHGHAPQGRRRGRVRPAAGTGGPAGRGAGLRAGGGDGDARGSCSGRSEWRLKADYHDGRIEVEGEVRTGVERPALAMAHPAQRRHVLPRAKAHPRRQVQSRARRDQRSEPRPDRVAGLEPAHGRALSGRADLLKPPARAHWGRRPRSSSMPLPRIHLRARHDGSAPVPRGGGRAGGTRSCSSWPPGWSPCSSSSSARAGSAVGRPRTRRSWTLATPRELLAQSVIEPSLSNALVNGNAAALDRFDRLVRERVMGGDDVLRVKIWDGDGRIVYSDKTELIGRHVRARRRRARDPATRAGPTPSRRT